MAKKKYHTYQFNVYDTKYEMELWVKFLDIANNIKMSKRDAFLTGIELFVEKYENQSR